MRLSPTPLIWLVIGTVALADDKFDAATRMLAVATFSAECPGIKPNYPLLKTFFETLGVDASDANSQLMFSTMLMVSKLNENKDKNCRLSWEQFGENGRALPRLLLRER